MVLVAGGNITKLCLESIQFDIDISLIGLECPHIQQLSVINARISVGKHAKYYHECLAHLYMAMSYTSDILLL